MKTQEDIQKLGDAVLVFQNLRRYCAEYTTGTRPSDRSIVNAIDVVIAELHAQASQDTTTSDR